MFEFAALVGTPDVGIALETRKGHTIANSQAPEPSVQNRRVHASLLAKNPDWVERKPPCGVYNCFGVVWASRRTAIYAEALIELILSDDCYRPVREDEDLRRGDLVLYRSQGHGILHVGQVIELRELEGGQGQRPIPWVLSKLGDSLGEVVHHYQRVPYDALGFEYNIEYWTDRP